MIVNFDAHLVGKGAVNEVDKLTQQDAAHSEETASVSEELNVQAAHMEEVVKGLLKIVGNVSRQHTAQQKHPSAGNKALIGA